MKPSVGRIVHYVDADGQHLAAVITFVHDGDIELTVFPPGVAPSWTTAVYDESGKTLDSWHWPERE